MEIDYVVPMVFEDDIEWRRSFSSLGHSYNEHDPYATVRWRSWNTEELLIRCVKTFMPWVRTIYILLAQESQVRDWMRDLAGKPQGTPEVRIVYHREFIPSEYLPIFNSQSIEMFLKDIPGLSEYFVYGNDDMFPVAPLKEEDFFIDGLPCQHYVEKPFPSKPNIFHLGCRKGLNFVASEFGKTCNSIMLRGGHCLTPMKKSTWEHLWERGKKEIENSVTAFRNPNNFNQYICPWWHHLADKYNPHTPDCAYTSVKSSVKEVADTLLDTKHQVVCVNDNECANNYEQYGDAVRAALMKRLNA